MMENNNRRILLAAFAAAGCLLVVFSFVASINIQTTEMGLRHRIEAKEDQVEAAHSRMWDILNDKLGLTKYSTKMMKDTITDIALSHGGNEVINIVRERFPRALPGNTRAIKDLSQSIEAERTSFFVIQSELRDIKREHDDMIDNPLWGAHGKIPFLKGKEKIPVKLITRQDSKNARNTGIETNNLNFSN